jgi:hypothetical protein
VGHPTQAGDWLTQHADQWRAVGAKV